MASLKQSSTSADRADDPSPAQTDNPSCSNCRKRPAIDDGLCRLCAWGKKHGRQPRRVDPKLADQLRVAYVGNRNEVSANITRLARELGTPRIEIKAAARAIGLKAYSKERPWSEEEKAFLEETAGSWSKQRIARRLKRSPTAVALMAAKLGRSVRIEDGYTIRQLVDAFGTYHAKVESWDRRGLLGNRVSGRISSANLLRFMRKHPHEYDLGRVDQTWFKAMIFGYLGECTEKGASHGI